MTRTRRSLRARRGGGSASPTYNVGDMVEVSRRAGGTSLAKLSSRLTDGTSPNSRWLVHLMDEGGKKDEIYEKSILRMVTLSPDDGGEVADEAVEGPPVDGRKKRGNRGRLPLSRGRGGGETEADGEDASVMMGTTNSSSRNNTGSSRSQVHTSSSVSNSPTSDKEQQQPQQQQQQPPRRPSARSCTTTAPSQPAKRGRPLGSKTMTNKTVSFGVPKASDKLSVSAREQRSRRRQAKMEDKKKTPGRKAAAAAAADGRPVVSRKRKLGASAVVASAGVVTKGTSVSNARETDRVTSETASAPKKLKSSEPAEEVVKVKLNTGTLYLYRGLRRRAEFVRRY